jgi:hypothetical protein
MVRAWVTLVCMLASFVLRLVPDELVLGRLVGQVVAIGSGNQQPVTSADDLVEFCRENLFGHTDPTPAGLGDPAPDL